MRTWRVDTARGDGMMMGWRLSTFSDSVVERERWSVGEHWMGKVEM